MAAQCGGGEDTTPETLKKITMENLEDILRQRYKDKVGTFGKPKKRARVQVMADRVHEKLGFGDDFSHYALLVRLCKFNKEAHIEQVLSWIADYPRTRNKLGLFMWKLKAIREDAKRKSLLQAGQ